MEERKELKAEPKVDKPEVKKSSFKERKLAVINKMANKAKAKEAFERVMRNK